MFVVAWVFICLVVVIVEFIYLISGLVVFRKSIEISVFLGSWLVWFASVLLGNDDFYLYVLQGGHGCGFGVRYDFVGKTSLWMAMWGMFLGWVFYIRRRNGWIKNTKFYAGSRGKLGGFFVSTAACTFFFMLFIVSQWAGACNVGKLGVGIGDQVISVFSVLLFMFFLCSLILVVLSFSARLDEMEMEDE
ncbi:hypothetical protein ACTSKR_11885 [Chitinibacteraceae bacterium HSL-7]